MAPKRSLSSAKKPPAKKPAKADAEVPKLVSTVAKALGSDTGLAESVVQMLAGMVGHSLSLLKEERHAYQEQAVTMIGEALAAKEAALEKASEDAKASAAAAIAEKEKLAATVSEKEAESKSKAEAETQAKEKVDSDAKAVKDAEAALKEACATQVSGDSALGLAEAQKTELELAQKDHIAPLVEGTAEDSKLSAKEAMKAAKKFISEPSLLETLPATLAKAKDSRGTFDGLVIKQMEDAFASALSDLTTTVSKGAAEKEARAAAVEAATQAKNTAKETLEASEKALTEAKTAAKEADSEVKLAKAAAKKAEPDSKQAEKVISAAASALASFKENAMGAFEKLKERVPPPPPPAEPEPEEAAPAAEPAAEPAAPAGGL